MLLGTVQAVSFSADPTHGRFPPPRTVEEQAAFFVVRDHAGQALAYVYFEDEPGRRRSAAKLLTGRSHDLRHGNHPSDGGDNDNKADK
jgi:hypothetical protein